MARWLAWLIAIMFMPLTAPQRQRLRRQAAAHRREAVQWVAACSCSSDAAALGIATDADTMVAHRRMRRMMIFGGERPKPPKVREKCA